jgi:hypothetical protein
MGLAANLPERLPGKVVIFGAVLWDRTMSRFAVCSATCHMNMAGICKGGVPKWPEDFPMTVALSVIARLKKPAVSGLSPRRPTESESARPMNRWGAFDTQPGQSGSGATSGT